MGHAHGRTGICHWSYVTGVVDDWSLVTLSAREAFEQSKKGDVLLNVIYHNRPPNARERRELAEVIRTARGIGNIAAHALVMDSKVAWGINQAINWIVQKPFEERCFLDPGPAFDWLCSVNDAFDAEAVRRDIISKVPPAALWRPFFEPSIAAAAPASR